MVEHETNLEIIPDYEGLLLGKELLVILRNYLQTPVVDNKDPEHILAEEIAMRLGLAPDPVLPLDKRREVNLESIRTYITNAVEAIDSLTTDSRAKTSGNDTTAQTLAG